MGRSRIETISLHQVQQMSPRVNTILHSVSTTAKLFVKLTSKECCLRVLLKNPNGFSGWEDVRSWKRIWWILTENEFKNDMPYKMKLRYIQRVPQIKYARSASRSHFRNWVSEIGLQPSWAASIPLGHNVYSRLCNVGYSLADLISNYWNNRTLKDTIEYWKWNRRRSDSKTQPSLIAQIVSTSCILIE